MSKQRFDERAIEKRKRRMTSLTSEGSHKCKLAIFLTLGYMKDHPKGCRNITKISAEFDQIYTVSEAYKNLNFNELLPVDPSRVF